MRTASLNTWPIALQLVGDPVCVVIKQESFAVPEAVRGAQHAHCRALLHHFCLKMKLFAPTCLIGRSLRYDRWTHVMIGSAYLILYVC